MALTDKQENFVQNIIKGMNQSDAYRAAYDAENMTDKSIHEKASELSKNVKVTARLDELRAKIDEALVYTHKQSFNVFQKIQDLAIAKDDLKTAKGTEVEKAKLAGLYVEKKDETQKIVIEFKK